jgi:Zn-dependent protease
MIIFLFFSGESAWRYALIHSAFIQYLIRLKAMDSILLNIAMGLPGFLLAIVAHEAAHAYMALKFGDDTAKLAGRVSLNPSVHLDVLGTIVFPLIGAITGGTMFGWAKPVPVDARRFKNVRAGMFWVSFAGPLMNIALGTISALLIAVLATKIGEGFYFFKPFIQMLQQSVMINFILAAFNLIPLPPLDGSKMVTSFLNYNAMRKYEMLANYSFLIFLVLMFTNVISYLLTPAVMFGNSLIYFFMNLLSH